MALLMLFSAFVGTRPGVLLPQSSPMEKKLLGSEGPEGDPSGSDRTPHVHSTELLKDRKVGGDL